MCFFKSLRASHHLCSWVILALGSQSRCWPGLQSLDDFNENRGSTSKVAQWRMLAGSLGSSLAMAEGLSSSLWAPFCRVVQCPLGMSADFPQSLKEYKGAMASFTDLPSQVTLHHFCTLLLMRCRSALLDMSEAYIVWIPAHRDHCGSMWQVAMRLSVTIL